MNDNIHIVPDLEGLVDAVAGRHTVVIADSFFKGALPFPAGAGVDCIFVEASEENKTLAAAGSIAGRLMELGADRDAFIIGIGGGITTDMTGFVASIYKRGVPFALVPTTLLSQVDASVGGKNGVNHDGYKNILGCFSEPESIWICPKFIDTLPEREFRCGLAEMLKTFIIADAEAYETAVADCKGHLDYLIRRCVEIKCNIVAEDPKDYGKRHVLNLGHTFAHAIEKCTNEFRHGEAVAIGIVMAARMAEEKGLAQQGLTARIEKDFSEVGLPVWTDIPSEALEKAICQDKKREDGTVKYVLPERIGKVIIWDSSATA